MAVAVRPVLNDWGLEEQTDALVQVLAAFIREGYSPVETLHEVLVVADLDDELSDWVDPYDFASETERPGRPGL